MRGPHGGAIGARAPPDALTQTRRLRLDGGVLARHASAGRHTLTLNCLEENVEVAARHVALIFAFCRVVAEALKAADNGFGRATGDTQLQSARRNEVCHGGKFSHVERVFVAHVNHTGAELDAFGLRRDRGE